MTENDFKQMWRKYRKLTDMIAKDRNKVSLFRSDIVSEPEGSYEYRETLEEDLKKLLEDLTTARTACSELSDMFAYTASSAKYRAMGGKSYRLRRRATKIKGPAVSFVNTTNYVNTYGPKGKR